MNGRNAWALVATIVLVTTVFAGCVQPDWLNAASSKTEISALQNKDLADNAAKAWNEKAGLLSVFTIELGQNQSQDNIPLDPSVGNGKAPVWFYVYCAMDTDQESKDDGNGTMRMDDSGSKTQASTMPEMKVFRVTADGKVAEEDETMGAPVPQMEMKDISSWHVDSPAALDAAKTNQTFLKTLNAPNASLAQGVAWIEGQSSWYFAAGGENGVTVAIVDAVTGKLVQVREMKLDMSSIPSYARPKTMPMTPPLHVEGKGAVASSDAKGKEFPFAYDGGPTLAQLKVSSSGRLPMDGLTWKLVGADGKEIKAKSSPGASSGPSRTSGSVQYALENAGEYKLVFQYRGPTSMMPLGAPMPLGSTDFSFVLSNEIAKPKPQDN